MKKILPILTSVLAAALIATSLLAFYHTNQHYRTETLKSSNESLEDYAAMARGFAQIQNSEVSFLAVGDISLSRGIAWAIQKSNDPLLPFTGLDSLLRSTDFNFGNLETPFSKTDAYTAQETLVFNAPKPNVVGLKEYNFAILNLANNHALDQGKDGITTTRKVLTDNGILFTGTGETLDEAWTPAVVERHGIRIGFIGASYSSINDGGKATNDFVARIEDTERLKSVIANLKEKTDFVVVTMHAGTEYVVKPNKGQVDFAHAAVDAGADIVIGHHPHWIQERELYCPGQSSEKVLPKQDGDMLNGQLISSSSLAASSLPTHCKPIYYSLGNFIFDQSWSEETKKGLALKITLGKMGGEGVSNNAATLSDLQPAGPKPKATILSIQEIPTYIQNNCCPTIINKTNK